MNDVTRSTEYNACETCCRTTKKTNHGECRADRRVSLSLSSTAFLLESPLLEDTVQTLVYQV